MLCFSEFVFKIGQDGPLSARHYNIVHFQQGVPEHVSETKFCRHYPEGATVWGIASLFRLFNGWRTFVGRVTMLLMPVMGGKFIWLGCKLHHLEGYDSQRHHAHACTQS